MGKKKKRIQFSTVQFSHSVVSNSLRPHEWQHARLPCPSPISRVDSNSCPSSWWCHSAISSSAVPFSSCPQSLPASGSFPMKRITKCQILLGSTRLNKQHDIGLSTAKPSETLQMSGERKAVSSEHTGSPGPFSWQWLPDHSRVFFLFSFLELPHHCSINLILVNAFLLIGNIHSCLEKKGKYVTKLILILKNTFFLRTQIFLHTNSLFYITHS